jgi:transcriptional regulator with XRE-family HTH domain
MEAARVIREARRRSGLSLRELAERAGTSHATLSAYEHRRVQPSVATLDRLVSAAGLEFEIRFTRRVRVFDDLARGPELEMALALAEQFPARHAASLDAPIFPGR